jgi:hypothetical protein
MFALLDMLPDSATLIVEGKTRSLEGERLVKKEPPRGDRAVQQACLCGHLKITLNH